MVQINNTNIFRGVNDLGNLKGEAIETDIDIVGVIPFEPHAKIYPIPSSTYTFTRKFVLLGVYQTIRVTAGDTTELYGAQLNYDGDTYQICFRIVPGVASAKEANVIFPKPILLRPGDTIVSSGNVAPTAFSGFYFGYYVD